MCRWLHPWAGVLFVATSLTMFLHWRRDMQGYARVAPGLAGI